MTTDRRMTMSGAPSPVTHLVHLISNKNRRTEKSEKNNIKKCE